MGRTCKLQIQSVVINFIPVYFNFMSYNVFIVIKYFFILSFLVLTNVKKTTEHKATRQRGFNSTFLFLVVPKELNAHPAKQVEENINRDGDRQQQAVEA